MKVAFAFLFDKKSFHIFVQEEMTFFYEFCGCFLQNHWRQSDRKAFSLILINCLLQIFQYNFYDRQKKKVVKGNCSH